MRLYNFSITHIYLFLITKITIIDYIEKIKKKVINIKKNKVKHPIKRFVQRYDEKISITSLSVFLKMHIAYVYTVYVYIYIYSYKICDTFYSRIVT